MNGNSSQGGQNDAASRLLAKAWADNRLKQRLLANPAEVLKEHGIPFPPNVTIRAVENTPTVMHFVIPAQPTKVDELSDDELEQVPAAY